MKIIPDLNKSSWLLHCFVLLSFNAVFSQDIVTLNEEETIPIDSLYREDQFYFGISYNTLSKKPEGLDQSKFSSGFSFGFLRDMPINKTRTVAIAAGIGLTYNNYNQNLAISGSATNPLYTLIDGTTTFTKNKFTTLSVDVPIEFRWRTSTYVGHKFWRLYTGIKLGYLVRDTSVFEGSPENIKIVGNKDFNAFQYGAYLSAGYNSINLHVYYGLNPLFDSATVNGKPLSLNALNFGIMFYIL